VLLELQLAVLENLHWLNCNTGVCWLLMLMQSQVY